MNRSLDPELCTALRKLRLGQLIDTLPARIAMAEKDKVRFEDLLLVVLTDEISRRQSTSAARRAYEAGLDAEMVTERWDPTAEVHFDKRLFAELQSLRFVDARRNVVILGPVGVGKTFLACALGHLACRGGYHVRFTRADGLLRQLRQSRLDNSRDALMASLCSVDLLIIDDFALEPMSRDESRDMYQLFVERNQRASTIVTSNRDTAEWLTVFDDMLQAQSAVDRFKNNAYDLIIEGESYRPRQKPMVDADAALPSSAMVQKTKRTASRAKRW